MCPGRERSSSIAFILVNTQRTPTIPNMASNFSVLKRCFLSVEEALSSPKPFTIGEEFYHLRTLFSPTSTLNHPQLVRKRELLNTWFQRRKRLKSFDGREIVCTTKRIPLSPPALQARDLDPKISPVTFRLHFSVLKEDAQHGDGIDSREPIS
jgi:hypothetical protein